MRTSKTQDIICVASNLELARYEIGFICFFSFMHYVII